MHSFDLDLNDISKIEGHTNMSVKVRDDKVTECHLEISEGKRFFKQAITGMSYDLVPSTMSRICGTCSAAHALCSVEAIENAYDVRVTKQTKILKNLLMNGGHLRDHAMHLYFFCLPDVFKKESVFDFKGELHKWVHDGLDVKDAGTFLSTVIGGRAVHPPFLAVGGFTSFPSKTMMKEAIAKLNQVRGKILDLAEVFYNYRVDFKRKTNYVALFNKDYNYVDGFIKTADGSVISEDRYADYLDRVVLPYSTADAFTWKGEDFVVGAVSRLNLNRDSLHKKTKKDCAKYLAKFPSDSVFDNNLAQAIECVQAVDNSVEYLEWLLKNIKKEKLAKVVPRDGIGVGVVEAPRGTLYYKFFFFNVFKKPF